LSSNKLHFNWIDTTVGNEIILEYGKSLPARKRRKGKIPVYGSNGITGYHDEALVSGPGIIVGRKGSVGEVKYSKTDFYPIDTTYYVTLKKKNDLVFWYYFLKTLNLTQMNTHSAVPGLNRELVYSLSIKKPSLLEQMKIGCILKTLDNKIDNNRCINNVLEEFGAAIFKRWFVDFEFPNKDGEPYRSSGGEMKKTENGSIPINWDIKNMKEVVDLQRGLSYKGKYLSDDGVPMINLGCIDPKGGIKREGIKYYIGEYKERHLVEHGDIVITNTDMTQKRELLGRPAIIPEYIDAERIIISHHIYAIKNKSNIPNWYLYYILQQRDFQDRAAGFATGTTVLALPRDAIFKYPLVIPSKEIINSFNRLIKKNIKMNYLLVEENDNLKNLRDTLLPRLMSGETRVQVEDH